MEKRKLGPFEVSALGFGCMSLSHAYGSPPEQEYSEKVLLGALDAGYTFLDTAALYGFGHNESLLGKTVMHRRDEFVLASKCGLFKNAQGKREINGHPEVLKRTCEESLKRLQTEIIDLYYLHRRDFRVPIEDSIGALAELVQEGKVKTIGMSEVSADTLRRAHGVHPITAVQSEYSLWTRNPEIRVLDTCRELGISFVAFSPLARGFFTGKWRDTSQLEKGDFRLNMPRFQGERFNQNLSLLEEFEAIAGENNCTMGQLALAWVLSQGKFILAIPGTKHLTWMQENAGAGDILLSETTLQRLDELINPHTIAGQRYYIATSREIDTEGF